MRIDHDGGNLQASVRCRRVPVNPALEAERAFMDAELKEEGTKRASSPLRSYWMLKMAQPGFTACCFGTRIRPAMRSGEAFVPTKETNGKIP